MLHHISDVSAFDAISSPSVLARGLHSGAREGGHREAEAEGTDLRQTYENKTVELLMAFDVQDAAYALALDTSNVFAEQNEDVIPFYLFFYKS